MSALVLCLTDGIKLHSAKAHSKEVQIWMRTSKGTSTDTDKTGEIDCHKSEDSEVGSDDHVTSD